MNSKIILAESGLSDSENLFECLIDLIGNSQSMIIEANVSDDNELSKAFPDTRSMQEARDRFYSNVKNFEDTCIKFHIRHATRSHFDNYMFEDLIKDSRLSDLVVCSSNLISQRNKSINEHEHILSTLKRLECPLLIIPEDGQNLMLTDLFVFNGSADSVRAIKAFTYLFPERTSCDVIVYNKITKNDELQKMTSWLSVHYHSIRWVNEFPLQHQFNIICGSIETSLLSLSRKLPVFICHS